MTKIYECNNHILIHTGYENPSKHSHMAAHIIISLSNKMDIVIENKKLNSRGIIIPSGISHTIDTKGSDALVFLYDCSSEIGKNITEIKVIDDQNCNQIIDLYSKYQNTKDKDDYDVFESCCLSKFGLVDLGVKNIDERVIAAIEFINNNISVKITCSQVASSVFLSQSRFSHLFKEEIGMSFSAYMIFKRIMYAYQQILLGKTITQAAVSAGFTSSSHFADINRRIFGLSATNITENITYTKV